MRRTCLWAAAATMLLAGCGGDEGSGADIPQAEVFVSVEPLAWFVQRIAGPETYVGVLVGPGQDPHTYEPTPRQMVGLGRAKLLLCVGMPFEHRLAAKLQSGRADLRIVDISEGLATRPMHAHGHDHAHHDHAEAHDAEAMDPHVWMSPKLAKTLAKRTCEELIRLKPAKEQAYRENLRAVLADLDALDARLTRSLAPLRGRTFFVFHPAFGYFADAYGLKQHAVEFEGKTPGPRRVQALVEEARAAGVKVIFVQKQFSKASARSIARQIGGEVLPLDPLSRDYLRNLEDVADRIERALTPANP